MRVLTFSFLKSSRLKGVWHRLSRQLSAAPSAAAGPAAAQADPVPGIKPAGQILGDPSLVEIAASWAAEDSPALRAALRADMLVLPDFVTEQEEDSLLAELEPVFKRLRYEFDHWDNAIIGYRETERRAWSPANEAVLRRVRDAAFGPAAAPGGGGGGPALLPATHVLDLAAAGYIKPHIDAVRFCGSVIAGLCLCSAAVMRLRHAERAERRADALLQRRALYIMKGSARYSFSHEVLGGESSVWRGQPLPRRRRVALISRAEPRPEDVRA